MVLISYLTSSARHGVGDSSCGFVLIIEYTYTHMYLFTNHALLVFFFGNNL